MNTPNKSWTDLVAQAQQKAPPIDLDVRHGILAEIASQPRPAASPREGLLSELVILSSARWMQAGLACMTTLAIWSCWQGIAAADELAALWAIGGPLTAQR